MVYMSDRELILKKVQKSEDRLVVSKALDKAEFASKTGRISYTDFLDPRQQSIIDNALSGFDNIEYSFYGGYNGAERALAIFRPDFVDEEDDLQEFAGFLRLLHIIPVSRDNLTHRDYLGALLSLGIKREKTGDLLVREEYCDVFVSSEIANFLQANLAKVGNTRVSVSIEEIVEVAAPEQKAKEISITVASLRLDCIAGPGFGMSRSKAAEFIKAGKLSLNWEVEDNPSKLVKEGDAVTIRGKGRVIVESVGGRTKKDRIGIILKKYI